MNPDMCIHIPIYEHCPRRELGAWSVLRSVTSMSLARPEPRGPETLSRLVRRWTILHLSRNHAALSIEAAFHLQYALTARGIRLRSRLPRLRCLDLCLAERGELLICRPGWDGRLRGRERVVQHSALLLARQARIARVADDGLGDVHLFSRFNHRKCAETGCRPRLAESGLRKRSASSRTSEDRRPKFCYGIKALHIGPTPAARRHSEDNMEGRSERATARDSATVAVGGGAGTVGAHAHARGVGDVRVSRNTRNTSHSHKKVVSS